MALWTRKNGGEARGAADDVRFVKTEHNPAGGTYHVYRGPNRAAAMAFLRRTPPKEELVYNIVETPQGNVGCDFIYIFEEADGKPLAFTPREPLDSGPAGPPGTSGSSDADGSSGSAASSRTHCARCGFFVVPYERKLPRNAASVKFYLTHDEIAELAKSGEGLSCRDCGLLTCIPCTGLDPEGGNASAPRCRACRGELDVFVSAD